MSESDQELRKLIESNAKSIEALTEEMNHFIREQREINRQQTERMDRLTDLMFESHTRLSAKIDRVTEHLGTLVELVRDHVNDNQRHNQPTE